MVAQTMGDKAFCSSIGDIEKHEKFKKLSKEKRIEKLQEAYDQYGVKSKQFFTQVKPFIMWTIYRYLRGMHYTYLEDLVNNAYEELVIAFDGGYTTHYNVPIYKEPLYGTDTYYRKYKNIGLFVMAVVGSSVAKYRSKNFRRQCLHEDQEQDISEKLNFTDFELNNNLHYEVQEPQEIKTLFNHFKLNDKLKQHITMLLATKPRNNIFYNFALWQLR